MGKALYSYETLSRLEKFSLELPLYRGKECPYIVGLSQDSYVELKSKEKDDTGYSDWKVHIAINPKDLGRAWKALCPVLLDGELASSSIKFLPPEKGVAGQPGKALVLYFSNAEIRNPKKIVAQLEAIDCILNGLKLEPHVSSVDGDLPVNSSAFCHFTYDKFLGTDLYIAAKDGHGKRTKQLLELTEGGKYSFPHCCIKTVAKEKEETAPPPLLTMGFMSKLKSKPHRTEAIMPITKS